MTVNRKSRRYLPSVHDHVIGRVVNRESRDALAVSLSSLPSVTECKASLRLDAFAAGSVKKAQPQLREGTLVFARVTGVPRALPVQLACVDEDGKSGVQGFGPLPLDRAMIVASPSYQVTEWLVTPDCSLFQALAERSHFEVAVGFNHVVWFQVAVGFESHLVMLRMAVERGDELLAHASNPDALNDALDEVYGGRTKKQ